MNMHGLNRMLLLLMLVGGILGGCSSSGTTGTVTRTTKRPPAPIGRSPLGVEYPDPLFVVNRVSRNMEAGDWPAACKDLADLGRNGHPVPLIPGKNVVAEIPPGVMARMRPFFEHLRGIDRPWVGISYGPVRNVHNDPPVITVPVISRYDYSKIQDTERRVILHNWSKEIGRKGTWQDFVREMDRRDAEKARRGTWPEWSFAWVRDQWRLYIGPPFKRRT